MAEIGDTGWRWWTKLVLAPLVAVLINMGLFQVLASELRTHGQTIAAALSTALGAAAVPLATGLVVYWLLKRQLLRAVAELRCGTLVSGNTFSGWLDTGLRPGDLNWAAPHEVLYVELRGPTFRASTDLRLAAQIWVGTHQRLPEGTTLVEWSVKFNLRGHALEEWTYKKRDITLNTVGLTQLYPDPELFVGDVFLGPAEQRLQLPLSCEVFLLVRVPGVLGDVKLNEGLPTQICRVQ